MNGAAAPGGKRTAAAGLESPFGAGARIRAVLFDAGLAHAGLGAVLFDPGGVWGARDCPSASGLREAAARATSLTSP